MNQNSGVCVCVYLSISVIHCYLRIAQPWLGSTQCNSILLSGASIRWALLISFQLTDVTRPNDPIKKLLFEYIFNENQQFFYSSLKFIAH